MSTRGLPKPGRDAHAVVIRQGRRHLVAVLAPVLILLLLGFAGVSTLFLPHRHTGSSMVMIAASGLGVLLQVTFWRRRHAAVAVDRRGVWVHNGRSLALIAWDSLAGVGVYESTRTPSHAARAGSLELCPRVPPEHPGPVLWSLVRDDEPLTPELGRLRYRIVVPAGRPLQRLVTAARYYIAPSLWCGEARREPPYPGLPDPALRPTP